MDSNGIVKMLKQRAAWLDEKSASLGMDLQCEVKVSSDMVRHCAEYDRWGMFDVGMDLARRSDATLLPPLPADPEQPASEAESLQGVLTFRLIGRWRRGRQKMNAMGAVASADR